MSSIRSESFSLDATGEVIATGDGATVSSPNQVLVQVTAGTANIGGAEADAVFPLTADSGIVPIDLTAGDDLWAKGSGATIVVFKTRGN